MPDTPQPDRREMQIAEIAKLLRDALRWAIDDDDTTGTDYEVARWLYTRGLRLVGGEAPKARQAGDRRLQERVGESPALASPAAPSCPHCDRPMLWSGLDGSEINGWYCHRGHQIVIQLPSALAAACTAPTALPEEPSEVALLVEAGKEMGLEIARLKAKLYAAERRAAPAGEHG